MSLLRRLERWRWVHSLHSLAWPLWGGLAVCGFVDYLLLSWREPHLSFKIGDTVFHVGNFVSRQYVDVVVVVLVRDVVDWRLYPFCLVLPHPRHNPGRIVHQFGHLLGD